MQPLALTSLTGVKPQSKITFRSSIVDTPVPAERDLGNGNVIPEWHSAQKPGFYSHAAVKQRGQNWQTASEAWFAKCADTLWRGSALSGDAVFLIGYFVATDNENLRWAAAEGLKSLAEKGAPSAGHCLKYIQPVINQMTLEMVQEAKSPFDVDEHKFDLATNREALAHVVIAKFLRNNQAGLSRFETDKVGKLLEALIPKPNQTAPIPKASLKIQIIDGIKRLLG